MEGPCAAALQTEGHARWRGEREGDRRKNGDKLGPTYDALKEAGKCDMDIIHSASRPNINIDKLLSEFEEWLRWQ